MSRGRVLVALQLVALLVVTVAAIARVQVWAIADEESHFHYVQTVADAHRLPLLTDPIHPGEPPLPPDASPYDRLGAQLYEAFQPPLYYLLATPAYALVSEVRFVRVFDALLLGAVVLLLIGLARAVAPGRSPPVLAAGLAVLLWPGVVVRSVTVSPSALEMVTVTALALVLWHVHAGRGRRWVLAAGALAGACLLTKTTLVFVLPVWLIVLALDWRRRRDTRALVVALVLPLLMLAPWLAFNHAHYGSLTATSQAQDQQRFVVNPTQLDFGPRQIAHDTGRLPDDVLPREWQGELDRGWVRAATIALAVLLAAGTLVAVVLRRRAFPWLLAAPALTGYVVLAVASVSSDWPTLVLRYLFCALPALAVATAAALPPRRVLLAAGVASVLCAVLWIYMAGAFMFTDAGRTLGIPRGAPIHR